MNRQMNLCFQLKEAVMELERRNADKAGTETRLHRFFEMLRFFLPGKNISEPAWDGYRVIGGYKVKEVFAGEENLNDLLVQYVDRIAAAC